MRLSTVEQPATKEARIATNPKQSLRCIIISKTIITVTEISPLNSSGGHMFKRPHIGRPSGASIGRTLTQHKQNEVGGQAKRSIEKKLPEKRIRASIRLSDRCAILSPSILIRHFRSPTTAASVRLRAPNFCMNLGAGLRMRQNSYHRHVVSRGCVGIRSCPRRVSSHSLLKSSGKSCRAHDPTGPV
jgi:hypothetical protein